MMKKIGRLPLPQTLKKKYPVKAGKLSKTLEEIKRILQGEDNRKLLIIGPCSLDNEKSTFEYLEKLAKLRSQVEKKLLIIPRLYTVKQRSEGGFDGLLCSPDTYNPDFIGGVELCRKILTTALNDYDFSCGDEMVFPENYVYFDDILSYVTVGTRSSDNQFHKAYASGMTIPVAFKNMRSGNLAHLAQSIFMAKKPAHLIACGNEYETTGNPLTHAIFRGYTTQNSDFAQNFHPQDITFFNLECNKLGMKNLPFLVDCSHGNSGKKCENQPKVLSKIKEYLKSSEYLEFKGVCMESYLQGGNTHQRGQGRSLTDECLDWEQTKAAVMDFCEVL